MTGGVTARAGAVCVLAVLLAGCGPRAAVKTKAPSAAGPSGAAAGAPSDLGVMVGDVYLNEFFGFTLPLPRNWEVESREEASRMLGQGKAIITAQGKEADDLRSAMDAALPNIRPLVVMSRKVAADAPVAIIVIGAMKLAPEDPVSELEGLRSMLDMLRAGNPGIKELEPPRAVTLGGRPAQSAEISIAWPEGTMRQLVHVMKLQGHVLYVNAVYEDSAEARQEAKGALESLRFRE